MICAVHSIAPCKLTDHKAYDLILCDACCRLPSYCVGLSTVLSSSVGPLLFRPLR